MSQPQTNASLNLAVLRRHNPSINQILSIAPFAAVYQFTRGSEQSAGEWEKTGIEGTLFVAALEADNSSFAVLILNRRGLTNFFAPLHDIEDVEMAEGGFVIVHADDDAVAAPGASGVGLGVRASSSEYDEDNHDESGVRKEEPRRNIYGLWIFSDAEDAQNEQPLSPSQGQAHHQTQEGPREINARVMMECATYASMLRKRYEAAEEKLRVRSKSKLVSKAAYGQTMEQAQDQQQVYLEQLAQQQHLYPRQQSHFSTYSTVPVCSVAPAPSHQTHLESQTTQPLQQSHGPSLQRNSYLPQPQPHGSEDASGQPYPQSYPQNWSAAQRRPGPAAVADDVLSDLFARARFDTASHSRIGSGTRE